MLSVNLFNDKLLELNCYFFFPLCVSRDFEFPGSEREKIHNRTVSMVMVRTVKSRAKINQSERTIWPKNCLPYNN